MISKCIFDILVAEKFSLADCISNEYLCAAMSPREMAFIIPKLHRLDTSVSFDDFIRKSGYSRDVIYDMYGIDGEILLKWDEFSFTEFDKRNLMFQLATNELEMLRHHTCQICGAEYLSSDTNSDSCDTCTLDIYKKMFCGKSDEA